MTSETKVVIKFNEWIKNLYQSNRLPVPEYALEIVRAQIHKRYGSTNLSDLNETKIARLLREINFEEFYGKELEILQSLESKAVPEISPKCKERMKQLLNDMQPAYKKHTKSANSNITFNYVMYKLCQQFEQKGILPFIKIQMSHEKLYRCDRIWHLICDDMKWYFIKSDPTICMTTPQSSPLLMGLGLNVNVQLDRDLEPWAQDELIKLHKGIEKKLSLEQLAVGHNRSLKNIETKLKELVTEYHESKTHNLESIKTLTGLPEDVIVDTISRYETRKSRSPQEKEKPREVKETKERQLESPNKKSNQQSDSKEMLEVLKDIQSMMRYMLNKYG